MTVPPRPMPAESDEIGRHPLLSAQAVADILGVSTRTLRRYVAAGALRPIRLGATLRFSVSDIEHLIEHGFPKT
jgi:excisionase family DNA binding protein